MVGRDVWIYQRSNIKQRYKDVCHSMEYIIVDTRELLGIENCISMDNS
jgi:hypothetical protein